MQIDFDGKLAIVTGSTTGIGFATAHALAQAGARVVISGRTQGAVERAVTAPARARRSGHRRLRR